MSFYFERVHNLRPTGRRNPAKINSYFLVKIAFEIFSSLQFCWTAGILNTNKLDKKSFQKLLICQGRNKKETVLNAKVLVYISYLYIYCFSKLYLWPTLLISHQSSFWFSCYDLNFPRLNFRAINRLAGLGKDCSAQWSQSIYKVTTVFKNIKPKYEFKKLWPHCWEVIP